MKRVKRFLALAAAILLYATSPVFADVAILPAFLIVGGGIILIVVIVIVALVLLIKSLKRRKARQEAPMMGAAIDAAKPGKEEAEE